VKNDDNQGPPPGEAAHAREHQRRIGEVVSLIRELTGRAVRCETLAEIIETAFEVLYEQLRFDVAVAVMLEQNLDLYLSTHPAAEASVNDALIRRMRDTLESQIPVSFATTDVIVRGERHDLGQRDRSTAASEDVYHAPLPDLRETHALLEVENRTAGLLLLYRSGEPFSDEQHQMVEIISTQLALLIANLNARAQILSLAETDDLTGIWNKRWFRRQLPQEVERARVYNVPLSLLMFDVDDFKQINDRFGHTVGDVVLSELCGAVRETLRPPDLFARFGGDEFAVILPHTNLRGAYAVAERIQKRLRSLTIPADDDEVIRCSISIGVADFQSTDILANDLVRRADERLYESKRGGKDRYSG
jgi:diguanylate cyclase (GGDEF)-like protein